MTEKAISNPVASVPKGSFEPLLSFVNGIPQASISVADRGLSFGDGVFETMLLRNDQIFLLKEHINRLLLGLERLKIGVDQSLIQQQLQKFLASAESQDLNNGIVKLLVTRGTGRGYGPTINSQANIIITLFPQGSWLRQQKEGVSTIICQHRLPKQAQLAGIKHLNRLDNVLASIELQENNVEEGLLFDQDEQLIEAVSRNVFIVRNKQLQTPRIENNGVNGVMRNFVIEKLAESVTESNLLKTDLLSADEVFVCNSVSGIWPVVKVNEQVFEIGPQTRHLQQKLEQILPSTSVSGEAQ